MIKSKKCEEMVEAGDNKYLFSAVFKSVEAFSFISGDPSKFYFELSKGETNPKKIKDLLVCTLVAFNGEEDLNKEVVVEELITDVGLTDCALLSTALLTHCIIGDIKKKQIDRDQEIKGMIRKSRNLVLMSLKKAGLRWGTAFLISTIAVCTIFKYIWPLSS